MVGAWLDRKMTLWESISSPRGMASICLELPTTAQVVKLYCMGRSTHGNSCGWRRAGAKMGESTQIP